MPLTYDTVAALLEAYRHRRIHVLVRGYMPSERKRAFARTLAQTRCPVMSDDDRTELVGMVEEMNREWTDRVISTLLQHPKKSHGQCWKCSPKELRDVVLPEL